MTRTEAVLFVHVSNVMHGERRRVLYDAVSAFQDRV